MRNISKIKTRMKRWKKTLIGKRVNSNENQKVLRKEKEC